MNLKCVIYVIDGAARSRFEESKHALERMLLDDQLKVIMRVALYR